MKTLYEILGISKDAEKPEIEEAYRDQAKIKHPDKPSGSHEEMKELNLAHDVLMDDGKRMRYDHGDDVDQPPLEKDALAFIVQLFGAIVDGVDVDKEDIVKLVKLAIGMHIQESHKNIGTCRKRIQRKQIVHRRLSHRGPGSYLHIVLKSDINEQEYQITQHERSIEVARKAVEMIRDYSYHADSEEEYQTGIYAPL